MSSIQVSPQHPSRLNGDGLLNQIRTLDSGAFEGLRFLAVDDDRESRAVAKELLQALGAEVLTVPDAVSALALLHDDPGQIDLVLMDIDMPDVSGIDATRQMSASADPRVRRIPVIAMSAHTGVEFRTRARVIGMAGYIPKPMLLPQILAEIQSVLG